MSTPVEFEVIFDVTRRHKARVEATDAAAAVQDVISRAFVMGQSEIDDFYPYLELKEVRFGDVVLVLDRWYRVDTLTWVTRVFSGARMLAFDEDKVEAIRAALAVLDGEQRSKPSIEDLIEASSLGTPEAKALRESVSPEAARAIVEASKRLGGES